MRLNESKNVVEALEHIGLKIHLIDGQSGHRGGRKNEVDDA